MISLILLSSLDVHFSAAGYAMVSLASGRLQRPLTINDFWTRSHFDVQRRAIDVGGNYRTGFGFHLVFLFFFIPDFLVGTVTDLSDMTKASVVELFWKVHRRNAVVTAEIGDLSCMSIL